VLAEQVCEAGTAPAPPTRDPCADEQLGEAVIVLAALVFLILATFLGAVAEEMSEHEAAQAAAPDDASADQ